MEEIIQNVIDADSITAAVEKRRTCVWYDEVATFYDGIAQVSNMQRFFIEHAAGFHTVESTNVWKEYTTDYYRMDGFYRQFHLAYAESLKVYKEHLNDLFAQVAEKVEGLYVHWFLDKLGGNWTNVIEDDLRQYGRILEVPRQEDFYNSCDTPSVILRFSFLFPHIVLTSVGFAKKETLRNQSLFYYVREIGREGI